ncbi:MAG: trypsin-like peptidase domain-containing protein, partial [Spirochaetales bacterium]|nr:trypsin-like peptidase domain-containing protein [Spirochaetales bacterium]
AIIEGNMILTNAHVVSDSTYIEVQKENDPKKYKAKVLYIGHQCDLALITVENPGFFKGTRPLSLSSTIPELKDTVATFGYPNSGSRISITEGVISRVEIGSYVHSMYTSLLRVQTDAAINPGNSGGPVILDNKIIGIAFQILSTGENVGYLIPVPIIKHFLEDVKDGRFDGFPTLGVYVNTLENPDYRAYLHLPEELDGIYISRVVKGGASENHLKDGDVILTIDGIDIANDGTIDFENGRISFSYLISLKQIGENIPCEVWRDGEIKTLDIPLRYEKGRISWYNEYETLPRYYIFGGIIFQVLSREFLKSWREWWYNADFLFLYYFMYYDIDSLYPERKEFVIINQILPDNVNTYVSTINFKVVDKINNRTIKRFEDVIEAFNYPVGEYHVIELDGTGQPVILEAALMEEANERILRNYGIPSNVRLDEHTGYGKE